MSRSIMLDTIREHGSRTQYLNACTYAANGNDWGIRGIYQQLIGATMMPQIRGIYNQVVGH